MHQGENNGMSHRCTLQYKEEAKKLRQTGYGVHSDGEEDSKSQAFQLDWYIPPGGPFSDTPSDAKNIWDEIILKFPFFARLHSFLSTRPNVIPPVVTTGITPHGVETIYLQPPASQVAGTVQVPDDDVIDPALRGLGFDTGGMNSPAILIQHTPPQSQAASTPTPGSRSQSMISNRTAEVLASIPRPPVKRTLEDVLMDVTEKNNNLAVQQARAEISDKRRRLALEEKRQVLDMVQARIFTPSEAKKKINKIDHYLKKFASPSPPSSPLKSSDNPRRSLSWDIKDDDTEFA
ncbi:hypothetical protein E1B28_011613 [Marasmius oreades]|uniref:Uncharacterized protein n=1 Tax=Marasmius oreades TaxID=181124 RepID=A0A9P7RVJ3_9AGAR|nr:uncharacterized protein E1B28_011613 [Marasmius oreades]KAG7089991.1 hypothetical protein E1B28_011613 [Marasmius oreades]